MNRIGRKLVLTAAVVGALSLTAPATGLAETEVIGEANGQVSGSVFDLAYAESRWVKNPKNRSISVKVNAFPDDPNDQDLIWVGGLMQCKQRGNQYDGGNERDHVKPPFKYRTRGFPFGVKKNRPKRCRLLVWSGFDPVEPPETGEDPAPPPLFEPLPGGTITIKILWKKR
ncbi:MAG: hypothetical protein ACRDL3_09725 [Solirubrobacterales bacterium]